MQRAIRLISTQRSTLRATFWLTVCLLFMSLNQVVTAAASPPTAVLSVPQQIQQGQGLILDGSRSAGTTGRIIRFTWLNLSDRPFGNLPAGQSITTTYPTLTLSSFPPAAAGRYLFQLVVIDDAGNYSAPTQVSTIVLDQHAPTAVLTVPQANDLGRPIMFDARRSFDTGGTIVRYTWTNLSERTIGTLPVGQSVVTQTPTYTISASTTPVGRYQIQLVVTDDAGNNSAPATASFVVVDRIAPTAVLRAPATVPVGQAFMLDGRASSDLGGKIVRYTWTNTSERAIGTFPPNQPLITTDPMLNIPGIQQPGKYTFQLTVTDDSGNASTPTTASVIVQDVVAPTAVLDLPSQVIAGQPVVLDGRRSSDIGGRVVRYSWSNLSTTPLGPLLPGQSITTDTPTLTLTTASSRAGRYLVQLVVTDDSGNNSRPATATLVVVETVPKNAPLTIPRAAPPAMKLPQPR